MKSDTLLLYLTVAVIVLLIVLFIISYSGSPEGFGDFYNRQSKFTKEQGNYFRETVNRSLPTNLGLQNDMKKLQNTLFSVDTMLTRNIMPANPPFNPEEDPTPAFEERNRTECETVSRPKFLKPRDPRNPIACGWWYIDDNNRKSVCALGTEKGPVQKDFIEANPGGEWIWDPKMAQKMEDAKACRRITSCNTADLQPECGFCIESNSGIPAKQGKAKYPDDIHLSCRNVVTNPSMCPKGQKVRVPRVIITKKGKTLRSGDVYKGEVIPYDVQTTQDVCDPNPDNGQLSVECLLSILKALGYSEDSVIVRILKGDEEGFYTRIGQNFDMFQITKRILQDKEKFVLRGQIVGDGPISKAEVLTDYRRIFRFANTNKQGIVKKAATWLVYGKEYDPCDYNERERGPFDMYCLKRVALEAGCQAEGYKFPNAATMGIYNSMTWSAFNRYFAALFKKMSDTTRSKKQRIATLNCLGITIAADAAILCGKPGGPCKVLTDSEILDNPSVKAAQGQIDFYTLQSTAAKTKNEREIAAELVNEARTQKAKILAMIRKVNYCPPAPPYACWDFSLGRYDDRLKFYASLRMGSISYATVAGKKAALFKGPTACVKASGDLSTGKFKSISMHFYINSYNSNWPRLWEITNGVLGGSWCQDALFGLLGPSVEKGIGMYAMKDCNGPAIWTEQTNAVRIEVQKWTHVVWAMDKDFSGMTIYINGIKAARWSDPNGAGALRNRNFNDFYIGQSEERFDKDIAIQWVRVFDYTMDEKACRADMADGWMLPPPPPVPLEPDSKYIYRGCFRESADKVLPKFLGNVGSTEECLTMALATKDATEFGLQNGGQCWVGTNTNYKKHGPLDENKCGSLGPQSGNMIYTLKRPNCDPSFAKNFQVLPGKMIAKIKHGGDYDISFKIKVSGAISSYASILHFSKSGKDCCDVGDRGPAIWFYPGTTKLYIILGDTLAGGDWGLRELDFVVPLNRDSLFRLSCEGKNITCSLDDKIYRTTQPGERAGGEFMVFSGDPWYPSAQATLSDFCFQAIPYLVPPPPPKFIGPAQCMDLGFPSPDNRSRLYSSEDCKKLAGDFHANGECYKKTGGSFSWECRELNNDPTLSPPKLLGPPACMDLGRASGDKTIRLYTEPECNKLNGYFHLNGECYKKTGGSYSGECGVLNKIPALNR